MGELKENTNMGDKVWGGGNFMRLLAMKTVQKDNY